MAKLRLGRWLAPIALIVALGAILAVINNSDVGGSDKKDSASNSSTVTGASKEKKKKPAAKHRRTYTVHTGDTLSAIAVKTGVPLDVILQLNPGIDEQTLHAGQKIKLVSSS